MVRIKICGITNLEDAHGAIAAGADMLGFNFYRASPRFIEPDMAQTIIKALQSETERLTRTVTTIGVFVNEPSPESLVGVANRAGVDGVQLHGDESVEFCRNLKVLLKDRFLIKAISVGNYFTPEHAAAYDVDAIMLDAFHSDLRGGTGRVVDMSIARRTRELVSRLFLAGGLSPKNVGDAIGAVQPYAVDACSALESLPGKKDSERMKAFVRAVRNG